MDSIYTYEVYICSVCIKVKRFSYKYVWFLDYQRAGVSFSTVLVLCYNQLSVYFRFVLSFGFICTFTFVMELH